MKCGIVDFAAVVVVVVIVFVVVVQTLGLFPQGKHERCYPVHYGALTPKAVHCRSGRYSGW